MCRIRFPHSIPHTNCTTLLSICRYFNTAPSSISLDCSYLTLSDFELIELTNVRSISTHYATESFLHLATSPLSSCPSLKSITYSGDFDRSNALFGRLSDISSTSISVLNLSHVRVPLGLDLVLRISTVISSCHLFKLSLIDCSLSQTSLARLCKLICNSSSLRELDCSYNFFEDSSPFTGLLRLASSLNSVCFPIFSNGCDDLLSSLSVNKLLRSIEFSGSTLSVSPLCSSLTTSSTLKRLILRDCILLPSYIPLFTSLESITSLLELEVLVSEDNQLVEADAKAIGAIMSFSRPMISSIVKGLSCNSTLKHFHVPVSFGALIEIYSSIIGKTVSTKFDVSPHLIDPSKGIFSFVGDCSVVDIAGSYMAFSPTTATQQEIVELVRLLSVNQIKELTLFGLIFNHESATSLVSFLMRTTTLESFTFQSFADYDEFDVDEVQVLDNEHVVTIINSLAFNTSIKRFAVNGTKIHLSVVDSICSVIKRNTSMTSIDFRSCKANDDFIFRVLDALCFNNSLTNVDFNGRTQTISMFAVLAVFNSLYLQKLHAKIDVSPHLIDCDEGIIKYCGMMMMHDFFSTLGNAYVIKFVNRFIFPCFMADRHEIYDLIDLFGLFHQQSLSFEVLLGQHYLNTSNGVFVFNGHKSVHSNDNVGALLLQNSYIQRFVLVECCVNHEFVTSLMTSLPLNTPLTHIGLEQCFNVLDVIEPLLKSL
ncbi:hypothetical protein GEMRC1_006077 [Eukaryota sp. GEM-RC1]